MSSAKSRYDVLGIGAVDPAELLRRMRGELAEGPSRAERGPGLLGPPQPARAVRAVVHGPDVELSHGISSGLLSTVAVRAGETLAAIEPDLPRRL
jgi:hypothetical protein